ncbi:hypothetical protein JCM8097_000878 [Rhodosporidiobolus ruineniae]
MRTSTFIITAAASASLVVATPMISTPFLYECSPARFEYQCDATPCRIEIRSGSSTLASGSFDQQAASISWQPTVSAGSTVTAYITNANGDSNASAASTVNSC